MHIPDIDIGTVAALARIRLTDEEQTALARELPSILSFVQAINDAPAEDTVAVDSTESPRRADTASESPLANDLVAAAPVTEERYVKARAVFDR